ncbi:hypothetical protein JY651_25780 [Pyxidicoccus parkwayensis]|uniref:Uncharacterized protein n=1 Tax=Pyxidicoccus parkwayensis TaxID=2813578 RepID=A0ABX7NMM1_9BACT|nr:hypothetical protein [Pyxidicoccus parkwaysis]QSQ18772.1 hypothetical protein JY651_25780 [Pyxidicoccus parkwaysis]
MIYGYSNRTLNEYGLQELREVTFSMTPAQLRQVAQFLSEMAGQMDAGALRGANAHRHMTTVNPSWSKEHPSADIIVTAPREGR